ncbi:MAG: hypothetical protein IJU95_04600, partial [Treponema sp.]|nr:hypothetical protein [Treponema sp.]
NYLLYRYGKENLEVKHRRKKQLSKGGYIFVHDYNSNLLGVEKAVDRYESECGSMLAKVPLSDKSGSLVVTRT